jgi:hypothetical protein
MQADKIAVKHFGSASGGVAGAKRQGKGWIIEGLRRTLPAVRSLILSF